MTIEECLLEITRITERLGLLLEKYSARLMELETPKADPDPPLLIRVK